MSIKNSDAILREEREKERQREAAIMFRLVNEVPTKETERQREAMSKNHNSSVSELKRAFKLLNEVPTKETERQREVMSKNPKCSVFSDDNHDMEAIERVFNYFDADDDGKISSTELEGFLRALGYDASQEEMNQMMTDIDKDGDGFIDLKEFSDFHRGGLNDDGSEEVGVRELRDAFAVYDKDDNGLISATELNTVLKGLGIFFSFSFKKTNRMRKVTRNTNPRGNSSQNSTSPFSKLLRRNPNEVLTELGVAPSR